MTSVSSLFRAGLFVLLTSAFSLPGGALAAAGADATRTVDATGLGNMPAGDQAAARDRAIKDAQRNAVEQAVGAMISSETKVENFQLIEDRVLSSSAGYLESYGVTDEHQVDPLTYQVTIRAVVKLGDLRNDLSAIGLCYEFVGKPRMMVLVRERHLSGREWAPGEINIAEHAIIDTFLKVQRKFIFVDEQTARRNLDVSRAKAALEGDVAAAAAIARTASADLIIVGEAEARAVSMPMLGSMLSGQANVTAKVIAADNGMIIATRDAHASVPHIDSETAQTLAIKKASLQLGGALMQPTIEAWCNARTGGQMIRLVVRGLDAYGDLLALEAGIQSAVRGVRELHQRSFDAGVAVYDAEGDFDAKELARELTQKEIGAFTIRVLSVSQGKLELSAKSAGSQ